MYQTLWSCAEPISIIRKGLFDCSIIYSLILSAVLFLLWIFVPLYAIMSADNFTEDGLQYICYFRKIRASC